VLPYHWAIGYIGLAALVYAMSMTRAFRESLPVAEDVHA
jgi:hypothetical protein